VADNHLVAKHRRCWGKEHTQYDPIHYLALLERKPGSLDFARPLDNWISFWVAGHSIRELTEAVKQTLAIGATSYDAVRVILQNRQERPGTALFQLRSGHAPSAGQIAQVCLS